MYTLVPIMDAGVFLSTGDGDGDDRSFVLRKDNDKIMNNFFNSRIAAMHVITIKRCAIRIVRRKVIF